MTPYFWKNLRFLVTGFGFLNIIFGFASISYIQIFGQILISLGIASFASSILIWIHLQPTDEKPKSGDVA